MNEPKVVGNVSDACFEINSADARKTYFKTIEGVEVPDPVLTKIIWPGPGGMFLEHWMSKGQVLPYHRHNSEFINFLVRGRTKVTLAGKQYIGEKWDTWTAVPGVEHSVEALEDSLVMEFFKPPGVILKDSFLTWGSVKPATNYYFVKEADARQIPVQLVEGTDEKVGESALSPKLPVPGPNVRLALNRLKAGKRAHHVHWHTWITYMVEGGFQVWMGGKEFEAPAGHYWGAAPGVDHENFSPGDSVVIEFKWPVPQVWLGRLKSWEAPVQQED